MDRMRSRRPSMRPLPADAPKPTYEDFKPETEWSQDSSNHILLIHLPGFKREEIRVQVEEETGKVIVTGTRKVTETKFISVDQSFPVPKDAIIDKIAGRFQNGYLTLIMPIDKQKTGEKRDGGEPSTEEKPKSDEQKKDEDHDIKRKPESTMKTDEHTKTGDGKKDEPTAKSVEQKSYEDPIQKLLHAIQKKTESAERKDEPTPKATPRSGDKNRDEPTPKEMPKSDEKQIDEKEEEKKKEEDTVRREKSKSGETVKKRAEEVMEKTSKQAKDGLKKAQGSNRKRGPIWKDGGDGWLDYGLIDGLLEKMHRNKKEIAVALVAFSVGFYVSHKMRTSGR